MSNIAVLIPMTMDPEDEMLRDIMERIFLKNAEKLKQDGTNVSLHVLRKGFTNIECFRYESLNFWNDFELFEAGRRLSEMGYDGLVLHLGFDSVLEPLKQILKIPISGAAQSAMIIASLMGTRFGVVTFAKSVVPLVDELIRRYGFEEKAVRTRYVEVSFEEFLAGLLDAHDQIERFNKAARACIDDGAEVLVPGCTFMGPTLSIAPGCEEYPKGYTEVEGVPIVDMISSAVRMAEVMVSFKEAGLPWISRAGRYKRPSEEFLKAIEEDFPYHGSGSLRF